MPGGQLWRGFAQRSAAVTFAEFREMLRADRAANAHNSKGRLIVTAFRIAAFLHSNRNRNVLVKIAALLVNAAYRITFDYIMGVYIPAEATVGKGLCVYHGVGLVVHPGSVIGNFCTLRQGVTIGSRDGTDATVPIIGSHVSIGANALVIGRVTVGDGALVGAGTVVLCDVPAGSVIVGNPGVVRND